MFGRSRGSPVRALVRLGILALMIQAGMFGFVSWHIPKLAISAVQQNSRVSHTKAITVTRLTGNEAMDLVIDSSAAFEVLSIRIHLAEDAPKEDLIAHVECKAGEAYCTRLCVEDMHNLTSWAWQPTRPLMFCQGSALHIEWPNIDGIEYGIEVYWRAV